MSRTTTTVVERLRSIRLSAPNSGAMYAAALGLVATDACDTVPRTAEDRLADVVTVLAALDLIEAEASGIPVGRGYYGVTVSHRGCLDYAQGQRRQEVGQ